MKENIKEIGINLLRVALVAGICYLIINDKDGWGWLLFTLIITL